MSKYFFSFIILNCLSSSSSSSYMLIHSSTLNNNFIIYFYHHYYYYPHICIIIFLSLFYRYVKHVLSVTYIIIGTKNEIIKIKKYRLDGCLFLHHHANQTGKYKLNDCKLLAFRLIAHARTIVKFLLHIIIIFTFHSFEKFRK